MSRQNVSIISDPSLKNPSLTVDTGCNLQMVEKNNLMKDSYIKNFLVRGEHIKCKL